MVVYNGGRIGKGLGKYQKFGIGFRGADKQMHLEYKDVESNLRGFLLLQALVLACCSRCLARSVRRFTHRWFSSVAV